MHTAQCVDQACFITLTYSDEHMPENRSLNKREFQLFTKRLRKTLDRKIQFLACGEYGPKTFRPHYHALIFGDDFSFDRRYVPTKTGKHFRSETLLKAWGKGFIDIEDMTWSNANYVAGYTMKKLAAEYKQLRAGGLVDRSTWSAPDPETGEVHQVEAQFALMSRGVKNKGGLGWEWFQRFWTDVYPSDEVILQGKKYRPPHYYDYLLKKQQPGLYAEIQIKRQEAAEKAIARDRKLGRDPDERKTCHEEILRRRQLRDDDIRLL